MVIVIYIGLTIYFMVIAISLDRVIIPRSMNTQFMSLDFGNLRTLNIGPSFLDFKDDLLSFGSSKKFNNS
jgi:hypothetical protein